MSPQSRAIAQLNRIGRVLELAQTACAEVLTLEELDLLEDAAGHVFSAAWRVLERVQTRGSAVSAS